MTDITYTKKPLRTQPPAGRKTQRARILRVLIEARGAWVPLPQIMTCAAQYNARIFELRRLGFKIENRTGEIDGARHSWFRLVSSSLPPDPPVTAPPSSPPAASGSGTDWYERQTAKPRPPLVNNSSTSDDLPLFRGVRS